MVSPQSLLSFLSCRLLAGAGLILLATACQTPPPVVVNGAFTPTPAFATRSPANVAVLPVEDGTQNGGAGRHLVFMRQEVMRQIVDRLYAPLTPNAVDEALRSAQKPAPGESVLAPANMQKMAGHAHEDAIFAVRVDRWDEGRIATDNKVSFQFQAALVGSDGVPLWSGTLQGEVKAGGAGPAPLDRDGKARSCATLAIHELLQRLPKRTL